MPEYIKKTRDSNIEFFRIIVMLMIVAHHYVVNSGLYSVATLDFPSPKSTFLLFFGWAGKTGIDCFLLITGYFMCKSNISLYKFIKLFGAFYFYKVLFWGIFVVTGYVDFSVRHAVKSLMPFTSISDGFVSCFLVFFCFIPFLNVLVKSMSKKQHQLLLILCLIAFSIFPQVLIKVSLNYVGWFMVVYLIGSYFRMYPSQWSLSTKKTGLSMLCVVALSLLCVWGGACLSYVTGKNFFYFFVSDANKPLAVATSTCAFLFFKNVKMGYSRVINFIAASTFGVLLIHANSDDMRRWLWNDLLDNVGAYSGNVYLHAVLSVLTVYIVCTLIDALRIHLFEKPLFVALSRKLQKNL